MNDKLKLQAIKLTDLRQPCKRQGACAKAPCRTTPLPYARATLVMVVMDPTTGQPLGAVPVVTLLTLN